MLTWHCLRRGRYRRSGWRGGPAEPLAALCRRGGPRPGTRGIRWPGGRGPGSRRRQGRAGSPQGAAGRLHASGAQCAPPCGFHGAPWGTRHRRPSWRRDHLAGHLIGHLGRRLLPRPARDTALRRSLMDRKRRTDLRLVLPALLVWGTAIAGNWWPPAELAALCAGMAAAAGILLFLAGRTKVGPVERPGGEDAGAGKPPGGEVSGVARVSGRPPGAAFAPLWPWPCCCPSRRARMPPSRRPGGMTARSPRR